MVERGGGFEKEHTSKRGMLARGQLLSCVTHTLTESYTASALTYPSTLPLPPWAHSTPYMSSYTASNTFVPWLQPPPIHPSAVMRAIEEDAGGRDEVICFSIFSPGNQTPLSAPESIRPSPIEHYGPANSTPTPTLHPPSPHPQHPPNPALSTSKPEVAPIYAKIVLARLGYPVHVIS